MSGLRTPTLRDIGDTGPRWFGPDALPLYGWLHAAAPRHRALGVVLCAPFGREELGAHATLRRLGDALAGVGLPTLRFDYPGCGDSAGDEHTPALLQAWIDAIGAASDHLRHACGVTRIAIVGVRLGALLGAQAAAQRDDVAALVALMPVRSGRAFVRELSLLGGHGPAEDGTIEGGGFRLTGATAAALAAMPAIDRRPAPRVLLVDSEDLPPSTPMASAWQALGADVAHARSADLSTMLRDPQDAAVPEHTVRQVTDWLAALAGAEVDTALHAAPPVPPQCPERIVAIDAGPVTLAGVLSPAAGAHPRGAVVLVNGGAARRIGSGRLHVELARRLASVGWSVLRVDIAGLGDSPAAPGLRPNDVYPRTAVDDLAAATTWLQSETGTVGCEVIGVCSGAYHAYRLAARGGPIAGFIAINPLTFGPIIDTTDAMSPDQAIGELQRYRSAMRDPARWLKLIRGGVDFRHVGRVLAGRLKLAWRALEGGVSRRVGRPEEGDVPTELQHMVAAGVRVRFVFAEQDPGDALLTTLAGSVLTRLQADGRIVVERIAGADHTFSRTGPRIALFERVERLLDASAAP